MLEYVVSIFYINIKTKTKRKTAHSKPNHNQNNKTILFLRKDNRDHHCFGSQSHHASMNLLYQYSHGYNCCIYSCDWYVNYLCFFVKLVSLLVIVIHIHANIINHQTTMWTCSIRIMLQNILFQYSLCFSCVCFA